MGNDKFREKFGNLLNAKDAIAGLIGILDGVEADNLLKPTEAKALDIWLKTNSKYGKNPPFSDICSAVEKAIEDKILEKSEIDDIRFIVEKSIPILFRDRSMIYLQGLIKGFAADGILDDLELKNLRQWLLENDQRLSGLWPFDELFTLILAFKTTNQISPEYLNLIKGFMNDYMTIGSAAELKFSLDPSFEKPLSAICATDPNIEFQNKKFCVTGISSKYSRKEIFDLITKAGGIVSENPFCDFLIVCSNGNGLWAFQAYGRKIEAALKYRQSGHSISIVQENDLYDSLLNVESAS